MSFPDNKTLLFFKKLVLFIVALIILDYAIGNVLKYLYFKQKSNDTTYIVNDTKEDLLVFGSSRANHQYVPSVFENKLKITAYNCGRDGRFMIYSLALMSTVLDRYKPKHIIFDLNPDEFSRSDEGRLSPLLPYLDKSGVRDYISYNSKYENLKILSKIYPYNSIFPFKNTAHDKDFEKGYIKLHTALPPQQITPLQQEQINPVRVKLLSDFLSKLKTKNIKITIVISPIFFSISKDNKTVQLIENMCKEYKNVKLFNYAYSTDFRDYKLYKDKFHLNEVGAQKFSDDLANKILAAGGSITN